MPPVIPSARVLVDTSVWVAFFRGTDARLADTLAAYLRSAMAVSTGPVVAELLSGIRKKEDRAVFEGCLRSMSRVEPQGDAWAATGLARAALGKQGFQTSVVDVWIALAARDHQARLWTLDGDFQAIRKVVDFPVHGEEA